MKKYLIPLIIIIVLLVANDIWLDSRSQSQGSNQQQDYNTKVTALQKQISGLQTEISNISKQNSAEALSLQEVINRQQVEQASETQSVTSAVAKAVPEVVSIIISENVPQYTIQYQNPFGNDPFFQNFGIQIPVYVPTGQTQTQQVGAGTGFIIRSNGYILTNRHVVNTPQANYTVLLANGKQLPATVVYKDSQQDIAIIKISGNNYPIVTLGNSSTLQLGQTVIAIGNALGQYNNSVAVGVIAGLNRTISAADNNGAVETLTGIIQTDAAINPGNSGGPLLDSNGDVVGVNVAMVQGSNNIGFAIPIDMIKSIITKVIGK